MKTLYLGEKAEQLHQNIVIIDGKALHACPVQYLKQLSLLPGWPVLLLVEYNQPWQKYLVQIDTVHGEIKRESNVYFL